MTLTRPWGIDAAFPNAADQRKQLASVYPRQGVFPDVVTLDPAGVAYAGTGWGVSARPFNAVTKRGGAAFSQSYGSALCGNDGVVVNAWTIAPAPVSGSRIDLLCIRARDTTQGDPSTGAPLDGPGGLARTGFPEFLVVAGTAATTPLRPNVPAGYLEVAQSTTTSGAASSAASTIIPSYDFAVPVGGVTPVRSVARRDSIVWAPGEQISLLDRDLGIVYTRTGTGGWVSDSGFIVPASSQVSAEGGGSISVAGDGTITFSGATAINLDGIFDGLGMDAYEVVFDVGRTGSNATGDWRIQYRTGGVTNANPGYVTNRVYYQNQGASGSGAANGTSDIQPFGIVVRGNSATSRDSGTMRIHSPKLARATACLIEALHLASGGASTIMHTSVEFNAPTLFDGLRLITSGTGAINGTLRIRKVS